MRRENSIRREDNVLPEIPADLSRARRHALQSHGGDPNVLGVFVGPKFTGGRPGPLALQFLVRRKGPVTSGRLPSVVPGRRVDGSPCGGRRHPTDVLEAGVVLPACGSGAAIEGPGNRGSIAILFRNRSHRDGAHYLITCAHVAGRLSGDPFPDTELLGDCTNAPVLARTVVSTTPSDDRLDFDIALARIEPEALPLCGLVLESIGTRIRGFMEAAGFGPVEMISSGNGLQAGEIISTDGVCDVDYPAGRLRVHNLGILRGSRIGPGDSGGLVIRDDLAIGILVARTATGLGLFHPLAAAFGHVRNLVPSLDLRIFEGPPPNAATHGEKGEAT